ncbi:MAG: VWA domain-containing protein [Bryobacteraceae bacterium]
MRRIGVAGLFCALAFGQEQVFRAQSDLVVAPVTVTGSKRAFVDGLDSGDFRVTDNGREQPFTLETADVVGAPVALAVVVQANDLARPALAKIVKVGALIEPLITGERGAAAVISFGAEVRTLAEFTHEHAEIRDAVAAVRTGDDSTARMRDAVALAAMMLEARPPRERKAILLISETRDRGSETELAPLVESLQRSSITLYAATFSVTATAFTAKQSEQTRAGGMNLIAAFRELGRLGKLNDVEALTEATGGERASFATLHALEQRVSRIGEELHAQYQLTYRAQDRTAGYHRVLVELPGHPKLVVRSRPGYWRQ